jgi:hypothetical protein
MNHQLVFSLGFSLLGLGMMPALAQETPPTRFIIVEPTQPTLSLSGTLNKGGSNPTYRPGESITISLRPSQDVYVYLVSIEADGRSHVILPNNYLSGGTFIRAGQTQTFPSPNAPYRFTISAPYGQAQVVAIATRQPLSSSQLASLRSLNQSTVQTRTSARIQSIVVEGNPNSQAWVTQVLPYQVIN